MKKRWLTTLMRVIALAVFVLSAVGLVATMLNALGFVPFYTSSDWFIGMLLSAILYQLCSLREERS